MIREGDHYEVINDDFQVITALTIRTSTPVPAKVIPCTWAAGKCNLTSAGADGSTLVIHPEYIWGGISGPLLKDKPQTMEATLLHDALYEALRGGNLPNYSPSLPTSPRRSHWNTWRDAREWADDAFLEILKRDMASHDDLMHFVVRWFGASAAWPNAWDVSLQDFLIQLGQGRRQ